MDDLTFAVAGRPQQRGSKRPVTNKKTGKTILLDDNAKGRPWMHAVSAAAAEAMNGRPLLDGPLRLCVTFAFRRPAAHYGRRCGSPYVKPSAPQHVAKKPDLDKLVRSIGDALAGVAYRDDAQVAEVAAVKQYTEGSEGAWVRVSRL